MFSGEFPPVSAAINVSLVVVVVGAVHGWCEVLKKSFAPDWAPTEQPIQCTGKGEGCKMWNLHQVLNIAASRIQFYSNSISDGGIIVFIS